jgi:hypothetical protein
LKLLKILSEERKFVIWSARAERSYEIGWCEVLKISDPRERLRQRTSVALRFKPEQPDPL